MCKFRTSVDVNSSIHNYNNYRDLSEQVFIRYITKIIKGALSEQIFIRYITTIIIGTLSEQVFIDTSLQ